MGGSREEDRLGRITWDAGNPAGGYIHGEGSHGILAVQLVAIHMGWDHMGFWQSSWWLYTGEGSHGILAVQPVAIYMGRDHMGFWQSSWWLYTVSQSVSHKISQSVNQSGVKEEEDLT